MIKITPVRYGATEIKESWVFRGGDPEKVRPISLTVYLIETEDRRILVDAGCDTMPGFDLKYHISPPQALLEQTGVSPREITATTPSPLSFSGRTGSNPENTSLICFLASNEAGYISGKNIMIDGCRKKM